MNNHKSKSLGEQLYDELSRDILQGRVPPGANLLSERKLAEARGLNRGAVREAMKRLAQMRLVRAVHGGGNRVEAWREVAGLEILPELLVSGSGLPDFAMLRGLLEMRATISIDAARLAAQRAEPAQAQELLAVAEEMALRSRDVEHQQQLVQRFWSALVRSAGNPVYVMAFNSLDLCWQRYGAHLRHLLSDELRAVAEYRAIGRACLRRDAELAARHARQLAQLGASQIEKMAAGHQQRQAVNNGDLFLL